MRLDMRLDDALGLGGDHRADIDGEPVGAADGELVQRALQHGERAVGDILLQAEHAQRRAALAGAVEGRGEHVADDLLGERRAVDDHRVLAAGLGDQRDRLAGGDRRSASCAWISRATSVEPVNITPAVSGAADQRGADARRRRAASCSASAGTPASCRMRTRLGGDQRRLLGGLGEHRIAGGERRRDLAGEDRQREIPRADADDRAERPVCAGPSVRRACAA